MLLLLLACTPKGADGLGDAVDSLLHADSGREGHDSSGDDSSGDDSGAPAGAPEGDLLTYAGPGSDTIFTDVLRLTAGTVLVSGGAAELSWIDPEVPRVELDPGSMFSEAEGRVAFILQLSPDLQRVLAVVHFPEGTAEEISRMRTTNAPGEPTGRLYVSGRRATPTWEGDGYFIAALAGNFESGLPDAASWIVDVEAAPRRAGGRSGQSAYEELQPWDVDAQGQVVYGRGAEYDYDWASLHALDAQGRPRVVEGWPAHWMSSGECYTRASDCAEAPQYSGVVLKAGRRGSLRSRTDAEFNATGSDGNGRVDRPGTFPDDLFFSGPCEVDGGCAGGPGYTGYSVSDKPTARAGGVVIDRRTGDLYFGYSIQSRLPDGNPDFEPAVVAMSADGELRWWRRLYEETAQNSSPDQYVDGLDIDYAHDRLVVLARCHGNNTVNLWRGHEVAARPDAQGFQNQFTGSSGNIHISWLGSLGLADGELHASTYVAEYANTTGGLGAPHADPNLDGWPDPNGGWPDLNTTRCEEGGLAVGADGRVAVACAGRRTITTADAWQKMLHFEEGSSTWNELVRVYTPDLDGVVYSSLVVGTWDPADGAGGGNTSLRGVWPLDSGVLAVGRHEADAEGRAEGNAVPVVAVPPWGSEAPEGATALLLHYAVGE